MTTKSPVKKIVPKKVAILHSCAEAKTLERHSVLLERISEVTLGNGYPEDGLLYKFRKFMDEHLVVVNDIAEIKEKLSSVTEINTTLEINRLVNVEVDKIKEKMKAEQNIKVTQVHSKKAIRWQTVGVILAGISVITLIIFQYLNYRISLKTLPVIERTDSKVDNLGTPVQVNTRSGEIVSNPDIKIKFFPKDFTGDSTKIDK